MEKLTEAELAALPERGAKAGEWANAILDWRAKGHPDCADCLELRLSLAENDANRTAYLCHELARALAPQPGCGHPGACVVSAPYIGENKSNSCEWCAETYKVHHKIAILETGANVAEGELEARDAHIIRLVIGLTIMRKERDALREKLKVAEEALDGAAEMIMGPDC